MIDLLDIKSKYEKRMAQTVEGRIIMLEWHDCKTDPPKESGKYLLIYMRNILGSSKLTKEWNKVFYFKANNEWKMYTGNQYEPLNILYKNFIPIKWTEIDLSEVK